MRKPGFLFVLPWELSLPGGVNQVVSNLVSEMLAHERLRPLVLIMTWAHQHLDEADTVSASVLRLRVRSPGPGLRRLVTFCIFLPATLLALHRILRRHAVSTVNVHYPNLTAVHWALLQQLGLFKGSLILSFHGSDLRAVRAAQGLPRLLWWLLLRSVNAVVACSESLRGQVVDALPAVAPKAVTIRNGLDVARFLAERECAPAPEHGEMPTRFILTIAAFEHKKGLDVLLRAFQEVLHGRHDVSLVVIGGSRPYRTTLEKLASDLGVGHRLQLLEDLPHGQVHAYLEQAMVFVLASREEPFGLVLLEAGAYHLPVIGTAVGGIPELITHGETGLLVPADDAAALAREISRLLDRADERERLGHALAEHVSRNFSWSGAYRAYAALVHE
jgi:glycosyltransferase involved in cell wall biosynthesis